MLVVDVATADAADAQVMADAIYREVAGTNRIHDDIAGDVAETGIAIAMLAQVQRIQSLL